MPVGLFLPVHALSFQRGLDRHWFHHPKDFSGDGRIDAGATKYQAARQSQHLVRSLAPVGRMPRRRSGIDHRQATPAPGARQQPGQKRAPTPPRLGTTDAAIGVDRELRLVPVKLRPVNIALVVILQQNFPFVKWFAMAVALAQAPVHQGGPLLAFSIGVSPGIKGVLQNRDHIAVPDRRPIEAHQFLAVGRPGKVGALGGHRHQNPAGAAQFAEPCEDQADHLLDPLVGIKPQPVFAMPDVADRHADS